MLETLWTPSPERIAKANLTRFLAETGREDFAALYRWSVEDRAEFWAAVARFTGVIWDAEAECALRDGERMPGAQWFPGSRLSFARNLLRRGDDQPALVFWNEQGRRRELTYAQLTSQAAGFAAALRAAGVGPGDRVAAFMPNLPETVVAMLGAASVGAVFSSCSPDFGASGVLDRFGQIQPKILVAADGYLYNGKRFDSLEKAARLAAEVPSIEHVVVLPYLDEKPDLAGLPSAVLFDEFLVSAAAPEYAALPFDHPLYILYSSGTTGKPKCIVHSAGGALLQHAKELVLHTDLKPDEKIFYFTTCGWMMWNWLVSSLSVGATLVLYDGSPFAPSAAQLWDMAQAERIDVFGTSAKYLAACEKAELAPARTHDLSSVRTILSTGSPLAPEGFDYVYGAVKQDVQLASISGGTDLISCFALGNPLAPVRRGEIQTRGLGMRVEVFDDEGRPQPPGEKGELVCTAAFPSMPLGFWDDPDGSRYRAAYFERFPGVWHHGDWCEQTETGGMVIWGRSDAVLNPGGVRIGTAEIYRAVEAMPEIAEACAVGQRWDNDVRVVLFVRLRAGHRLDEALVARIRGEIRAKATPRHVPAKVIAVADIPRTRNGKIAELAVRNVLDGLEIKNREALANPEALALYRDVPELRS